MSGLPAFYITRNALKQDPALKAGARGARKLIVTERIDSKERRATGTEWQPPAPGEKCSVQVMADTEIAVFNQHAKQDRHYHKNGTEIYMVIEGSMTVEVEGKDYVVKHGDMLAVNPKAFHQVKPDGSDFLCRVITLHCGGASDKFTV